MNEVKVHYIINNFEDEIIFNYDAPSEVQPMFEDWLFERGLNLNDLDSYWGEQINE